VSLTFLVGGFNTFKFPSTNPLHVNVRPPDQCKMYCYTYVLCCNIQSSVHVMWTM